MRYGKLAAIGPISKPLRGRLSFSQWLAVQLIAASGWLLRPLDFRGLFAVARATGRFGEPAEFWVQIHPEVWLPISARDPYWLCYTVRGRMYEPEVERLLELIGDVAATFVDCGANLGYWSILVSKRFGWQAVAIEAAPETYRRLQTSVSGNGDLRIRALHAAVGAQSGQPVSIWFEPDFHAAARVATPGEASGVALQKVESLALDTLDIDSDRLVVVKLDVEGNETQALEGAGHLLSLASLVIYEEHGSQDKCDATSWLLKHGFSIFYLTNKRALPIASKEDAVKCLTRSSKGYNFAATKTDFVLKRLVH